MASLSFSFSLVDFLEFSLDFTGKDASGTHPVISVGTRQFKMFSFFRGKSSDTAGKGQIFGGLLLIRRSMSCGFN